MKQTILLLMLAFVGHLFAANSDRVIRIGGSPMPPLVYLDTNDQVAGIIPQLVDQIAKESNWKVLWSVDSWAKQLERLESGEIDIMSGIGYSVERAIKFDFSEQSVLSVWGQLYTKPGYQVANFLEVDNKSIGILNNGISGLRFIELCKKFGVDCHIKNYDSFRDVFKAIHSGEVDAGVVNSHYGFVVENEFNVIRSDVMFNPFPVLFATKKDRNKHLLDKLDSTLGKWKNTEDSYYYIVTDSWLTQRKSSPIAKWLRYLLTIFIIATIITAIIVFILRGEVRRRTFELNRSEEQLKQIIDLVPHAIFASDQKGHIILANKETVKLFEKTLEELKHLTIEQLIEIHPYYSKLLNDERVRYHQKSELRQEISVCPINKEMKFYDVAKVPFVKKDDCEEGVVSVAVDITEQKLSQDKIAHMAKHDDLTGLPNRSFLMDRLEQSLLLAKRHKRFGAVMFIDMDLFKNINDTMGHSVGDELLKITAKRIDLHCRTSDTVSRFGGDEFVVLLNELGYEYDAAKQNAKSIAKKIQAEVIKEVEIGGNNISISISQGLVFFPFDATNTEQIIKRADLAMYHAKLLGRNKVVTFHPQMEQRINRQERLKTELKSSIKEQQLEVLYQPQYNIKTNQIEGAEALLRWYHPFEDFISPMEFIPLAEESDTILALGEFVLSESFSQLLNWQKSFGQQFYITVNLSARQIASDLLIPFIDNLIKHADLSYHSLELEVTESLLMMDMERAVDVLSQLKKRGIKISLDDFGTGYSSLSYLKKLPLDKLKIDKSFVNDIPGDHDSEAIARTIISMASELGLEVVAEGIESEAQVEFFREQGCYLFQGFYFSQPCTVAELNRALIKQKNQA
ncbi:MAG: EAL domain-containing protein [Gammaproteobacteria bacterium]|nr:EAL domain-containing protein [Gammaproteobacteria bacterium]